jgi:hypothetical protein
VQMNVRGHHLEEGVGKQLHCTGCLRPWCRLRAAGAGAQVFPGTPGGRLPNTCTPSVN